MRHNNESLYTKEINGIQTVVLVKDSGDILIADTKYFEVARDIENVLNGELDIRSRIFSHDYRMEISKELEMIHYNFYVKNRDGVEKVVATFYNKTYVNKFKLALEEIRKRIEIDGNYKWLIQFINDTKLIIALSGPSIYKSKYIELSELSESDGIISIIKDVQNQMTSDNPDLSDKAIGKINIITSDKTSIKIANKTDKRLFDLALKDVMEIVFRKEGWY